MPMTQMAIDTFNAGLTDALPRLRVYALSLTRDRERAENLVQQTSLKALVGRESFRPGTNFGAWIFRIQRNEFISQLRSEGRTADTVDAETALATPPAQENRLVMREFMAAFRQLSRGSRQALILSKIAGHSHEQIASHAGIAEGTVKSRISHGRAALERLLAGNTRGSGSRSIRTVQREAGGSRSVGVPAMSR
jgi:RNA polymerase sigma-70 factor (ECF subfamily)